MEGFRAQVFQAAVEIALRATLPQGGTIANVVDRLSGSNRMAVPGEYKDCDWAADFLACLPECEEMSRLMLLCYLPAYVCGCNAILLDPERCDVCGMYPELYRMRPHEARQAGGVARGFWGRVQGRRLYLRGLRIVHARAGR
jgi:hypothetical protein